MSAKPATIVRHSLKLREGISITVAKELEKSAKQLVGEIANAAAIWGGVGINKAVQGSFNGKPVKPIKYAHLVEFGHNAPDGSYVPAKPFMRPAIAKVGSGTEFVRRLEAAFLKGVEAAKTTEIKK